MYFLTNQVHVGAGPFGGWAWLGPNSFGLLLIPLLLGVAILCANGRSIVGRLLTGIGAVLLLASLLDTLRITFRPTSLFNTLMMLGLTVAGVGLLARALLSGDGDENEDGPSSLEVTEEKERLQGELATAKDRIRALEAPREPTVAKQPMSVDDQLAELVRLKRGDPPKD